MAEKQIAIRTEDDRVFYDMPEQSPCTGCGACCRHFRISFYQGELDTQPGGFVPADLTQSLTPFLACMKGTEKGEGRCIALQGDNRCGIYEHRPSPCREFRVFMDDGSLNAECVRLKAKYGIV